MSNSTAKPPRTTRIPKQARAKKTYENILQAAQEILEDAGLEALNSNAIVERAGVTAPVFYRYFVDKYELLQILGNRLITAQDELLQQTVVMPATAQVEEVTRRYKAAILEVFNVTKNFTGAHALLVSLRALPNLSSVRLESNAKMARLAAQGLVEARPDISMDEAYERCRLAIEIGYGAIEMLLELPDLNPERVLNRAIDAAMRVYLG